MAGVPQERLMLTGCLDTGGPPLVQKEISPPTPFPSA